MTARRLDLTIAAVGITVLGIVTAYPAGWWFARTAAADATLEPVLSYQDTAVVLLLVGLLALYPVSTTILSLISRPAAHPDSSRRAGTAPVESRRAGRRSGSRRTSRALTRGGARLVRHKTAGGGARLTLPGDAAAGPKLPARRTRPCSPTVRVTHHAPGRETTVGGAP